MADQRPITKITELSEKTAFLDPDLVLTYNDALSKEQKMTFGTLRQEVIEKATVASASGAAQTVAEGLDARVIRVGSVSELAGVTPTDNLQVNVEEYHLDINGGGGIFAWDATAIKNTHNGGTVIDPDITFPSDWDDQTQLQTWFDGSSNTTTGCWIRKFDSATSVRWFGAKGDWNGTSGTDDTKSLQKTVDIAHAIDADVYVNGGDYLITDTIALQVGTKIYGSGVRKANIQANALTGSCMFSCNQQVIIEDLGLTLEASNKAGIEVIEGRNARINRISIKGDGTAAAASTTTGIVAKKDFEYCGFVDVSSCNFSNNQIDIDLQDVVTSTNLVKNYHLGNAIDSANAVKISSNSVGISIDGGSFNNYEKAIESDGTYIKISSGYFERNINNVTLRRGATNSRIWGQLINNTFIGAGTVEYPKNAVDLVSQFDVASDIYAETDLTFGGVATQKSTASSYSTLRHTQALSLGVNAPIYMKVASITFPSQFTSCTAYGTLSIWRNGVEQPRTLNFTLGAIQSDALGTAPVGILTQSGIQTNEELYAITTVNDANSTVVELWMYKGSGNNLSLYYDTVSTGNATFEGSVSKDTSESLPSGTQDMSSSNIITTMSGNLQVENIPIYADNAAAIAGGLSPGALYRVDSSIDPEPLYVVH